MEGGAIVNGITQLHHLSLKVAESQYETVVDFYKEILGLKVIRIQDNATFLSCENVILEILISDDSLNTAESVLNHFAFKAEDVDGLLERVKDAGYQVSMQPTKYVFQGKDPYPVYIAFFVGPAGESVELFREMSAAEMQSDDTENHTAFNPHDPIVEKERICC